MLRAMRDGAQSKIIKFLLFGILVMALFGLAMMDVAGVFTTSGGTGHVAKVGGQKIPLRVFDRSLRRNLRDMGLDLATARREGLVEQILMQDINRVLISLEADNIGLRVDKKIIAQDVKRILAPYMEQDESLSEKELLQRILYNRGQSEQEFTSALKFQTIYGQLASAIATGAHAPKTLVRDLYRYQNEERKGSYITFTRADAKDIPTPTEEELLSFYETVSLNFALPERRAIKLAILKPDQLEKELSISEEELKAAYEDRIDEYTFPERRMIGRAAVGDKETADAIVTAARNSKNLAQAVKDKGGATDLYFDAKETTQPDMEKAMADIAFALDAGGISDPFETDLGWQILSVEKILPAETKSFATVKDALHKELKTEQAANSLYEAANRLDDLLAGGAGIEEAAAEMVLPVLSFEPMTRNGTDTSGKTEILTIPEKTRVLESAFALSQGESAPLIESETGGFIAVEVTEIIPAQSEAFENVKPQLTKLWRDAKAHEVMKARADEIIEKMKTGETLQKIADTYGKAVQPIPYLKRSLKEGSISTLPAGLKNALFSLQGIEQAVAIQNADSYLVIVLGDIRIPEAGSEEDLESVAFTLNRNLQDDLLAQYQTGLAQDYGVKINETTLKAAYDNPVESY